MIDLVQALDDPNLFGPWFAGPSWATWKSVLKAAFCIPMDADDLKLFRGVAERDPPKRRVRELWAVVGRRGGKDSVASAVACFAAGFVDYKKILRPGERASVLCLAVDKAQAGIVERYTRSYFSEIALLRGQVKRETADGVELVTGAELDVLASNFRNVRGRSIACVIMDEVAFWRSETTANPDVETYQALVPSLATIPGAMLIGISTPYRRAGLLYQKWKDYFGQDDDDVLVVHGASRAFNPTLPQSIIDDALKRDPAAARAEWGGPVARRHRRIPFAGTGRGCGRSRRGGSPSRLWRCLRRLLRSERRSWRQLRVRHRAQGGERRGRSRRFARDGRAVRSGSSDGLTSPRR